MRCSISSYIFGHVSINCMFPQGLTQRSAPKAEIAESAGHKKISRMIIGQLILKMAARPAPNFEIHQMSFRQSKGWLSGGEVKSPVDLESVPLVVGTRGVQPPTHFVWAFRMIPCFV